MPCFASTDFIFHFRTAEESAEPPYKQRKAQQSEQQQGKSPEYNLSSPLPHFSSKPTPLPLPQISLNSRPLPVSYLIPPPQAPSHPPTPPSIAQVSPISIQHQLSPKTSPRSTPFPSSSMAIPSPRQRSVADPLEGLAGLAVDRRSSADAGLAGLAGVAGLVDLAERSGGTFQPNLFIFPFLYFILCLFCGSRKQSTTARKLGWTWSRSWPTCQTSNRPSIKPDCASAKWTPSGGDFGNIYQQ